MSTPPFIEATRRMVRGKLGRIVSGDHGLRQVYSLIAGGTATAQSFTLTATSPDNTATYTVTVSGGRLDSDRAFSFTTDASATAAELEAGLLAAWQADAILNGIGSASVASGNLVITIRDPGAPSYTFTLTANPSAALALSTSAAAAGSAYPFGRFIRVSDAASYPYNQTANLLTAAAGPVLTYTITNDASGTYVGSVSVSDPTGTASGTFPFSFSGNANADTTDDNAVAAFTTIFPYATITNPSTGSVVVSFPIGFVVAPVTTSASGGSADLTVAFSAATGSVVSLALVLDPADIAPASIGADVTEIPAGRAVTVLKGGRQDVGVEDPGSAVTFGGIVWVETADGANKGRPYPSPSPSRQAAIGSEWVRDDEVAADLSYVRIIDLG